MIILLFKFYWAGFSRTFRHSIESGKNSGSPYTSFPKSAMILWPFLGDVSHFMKIFCICTIRLSFLVLMTGCCFVVAAFVKNIFVIVMSAHDLRCIRAEKSR